MGRDLTLDILDAPARAPLILLVDMAAAFDELSAGSVAAGVTDLQDGAVGREIVVGV